MTIASNILDQLNATFVAPEFTGNKLSEVDTDAYRTVFLKEEMKCFWEIAEQFNYIPLDSNSDETRELHFDDGSVLLTGGSELKTSQFFVHEVKSQKQLENEAACTKAVREFVEIMCIEHNYSLLSSVVTEGVKSYFVDAAASAHQGQSTDDEGWLYTSSETLNIHSTRSGYCIFSVTVSYDSDGCGLECSAEFHQLNTTSIA